MLRRLGVGLGAATGGYLYWDRTYNYNCVGRSVATFYAAFETYCDFKFRWEEGVNEKEIHGRVAHRMFKLCRDNGGLFIKLGQSVAMMNVVLPLEYQELFAQLHDRCPSVGIDDVNLIFMEEFGKLPSEMFKEFDEEAIASASIAQVHRATLFDGTKVAVKVQKPSIRAQLKWDLACYKLIVRLFEWNFDLPIYWTVPTTVDAVTSESDFRCEAEYTRRSGELLEDDTGYVPEIYNDLTTSRVMVMEWIDGVKITDSKALQKLGFSTKQAMENVVKIFSHQLFVTGLVHADPHPGNMFIRAHPANPRRMQVVLLDHGLCIDQREEFRMQYCDLWKSMILMDNAGVRRVCEQWGIGDADLFATMQLMKPFNSTAQAQAPQQNVIDRQVNKKDINNFRQSTTKDRIRALLKMTQHIPTELVLVGRHINIIRGVNKMLGIPVNRINVMARYAVRGEQVTRSANVTPEGQLRIPLSMRFSQNWAEFKFNMHLFWIDVLYYTVRAWNTMKSVMISDHPFKAKDIEDIVQAGMGVMLPNVEVDVDFG